jgi:uncharacterized protein with PIN domain
MDMSTAFFRFYEELNDFLPPARRKRTVSYAFRGSPSVKHAIEALGVPHPEVDLVLANGTSVDFGYRVCPGDRVSVYPVFESLDISPLVRLRPEPLRRSRFILDVHLGKLARMMRLLGFDSLYRNDYPDPEIVHIAAKERRIILTRDRHLLQAGSVTRGYWVRSGKADIQVGEVLRRFDLTSQIRPFRRCLLCNGEFEKVQKADILPLLEPKTIRYYDLFFRCRQCGQIYWKGTHFDKLERRIARWMDGETEAQGKETEAEAQRHKVERQKHFPDA